MNDGLMDCRCGTAVHRGVLSERYIVGCTVISCFMAACSPGAPYAIIGQHLFPHPGETLGQQVAELLYSPVMYFDRCFLGLAMSTLSLQC